MNSVGVNQALCRLMRRLTALKEAASGVQRRRLHNNNLYKLLFLGLLVLSAICLLYLTHNKRIEKWKFKDDFSDFYQRVLLRQSSSFLYEFDNKLQVPLLRLNSAAESDSRHRAQAAAAWLNSSVDVVFAASVRNAMRGLPDNAKQMLSLAGRFRNATFVFVENDSTDETRRFLVDWRRRDPRVWLLGCAGKDSACRMNISYSSGLLHRQGWSLKRSPTENRDRGIVMSALRNIYLRFIYDRVYQLGRETLLIVLDPDLSFKPWDQSAILQGLYYFRDRPALQSLCAHTRHGPYIYDHCTLVFPPFRLFSQNDKEPKLASDFRSKAPPQSPAPIKMTGCFQAFTAYRLSHLASQRLEYGPAHEETICEHLSLSRQLSENYLDFNMRLYLVKQNEGGM